MSTSGDMTACPRCGHRNPSWHAACEQCGTRLSLASSDFALKRNAQAGKPALPEAPQLSLMAHVMCGWPLILVAVGGLIGGALGGLAYAINLAAYKSRIPAIFKLVINLGVGFAAIAVWLLIAVAIRPK
jgi:hypothetical protein